jgi:large repetitive protein
VPPTLVYTPDADFNGSDLLSFRVSDGEHQSQLAYIDIQVIAENDPPVPQNMEVTLLEDSAIDITLHAIDIDGGVTFWSTGQPAHGTVTGTPPLVRYTPDPDYSGPDSFTFTSQAFTWMGLQAQVQITVQAVDDAPTAQPQTIGTLEDSSIGVTLTVSDVDGGTANYQIVSGPSHGTLSGSAPDLTYTPEPNYSGTDSFTFAVDNGTGIPSEATVHIQITSVNDTPVAQGTSVATAEDGAIICPILVTDLEGDELTFTIIRAPDHGSLGAFGTAPYTVNYFPSPDFYGTDSFDLQANDGTAIGNVFTITVQVSPVDDEPVALAQTLSVQEDTSLPITLSVTDIDGGPLTWQIVSPALNGTLSGTPPNLTYTPDSNFTGEDRVVFAVGTEGTPTSEATVNIQVLPVNDAPIAIPGSSTTPYNTPVSITLSGADPDSGSLSYSLVSTPANGTLSGSAPNLIFTPNIGWSGTTSFSFQVSDGELSAVANVSVTVQSTDAPPTAPSVLTAQVISKSQIDLSWDDNSGNEDGFRIERLNGASYSEIATVGRNVRVFSNTGLSANKSYSYRVRAFNMRGNSAYSNVVSAKTLK